MMSDSTEFVRALIDSKTEERVRNPEVLRDEIRKREEDEARRQEEEERIQKEERRRRAKMHADAAEKRIANKKANKEHLDSLKNDKRFQTRRQDKEDEIKDKTSRTTVEEIEK